MRQCCPVFRPSSSSSRGRCAPRIHLKGALASSKDPRAAENQTSRTGSINCTTARPGAVIAPGACRPRAFRRGDALPYVILQPQAGPSVDHLDGGGALLLEEPDLQLRDFGASDPNTYLIVNVCWSMSRQPVIVTTSAFSASIVSSGVAGFDGEAVGWSSGRGRDVVVAAAVADGLIRSAAALARVERSVVEVFLVAAELAPPRSSARIRVLSPRFQRAAEWWVLKRACRHAGCRTERLLRSGSPRRPSRPSQGRLRAYCRPFARWVPRLWNGRRFGWSPRSTRLGLGIRASGGPTSFAATTVEASDRQKAGIEQVSPPFSPALRARILLSDCPGIRY